MPPQWSGGPSTLNAPPSFMSPDWSSSGQSTGTLHNWSGQGDPLNAPFVVMPLLPSTSANWSASAQAQAPGGSGAREGEGGQGGPWYLHPQWRALRPVPPWTLQTIGALMTAVGLTGAAGNIALIVLLLRHPKLQTSTNMFVLSMAAADLLMCLGNFPLLITSAFSGKWVAGYHGCKIYGFIGGVAGFLSINSLTAMACDRYNVIYRHKARRRQRVPRPQKSPLGPTLSLWIYSFFWAMPPFFGWGHFALDGGQISCCFDYLTGSVSDVSYIIAIFIFCFGIQVVVIIYCYTNIALTICKHHRQQQQQQQQQHHQQLQFSNHNSNNIAATTTSNTTNTNSRNTTSDHNHHHGHHRHHPNHHQHQNNHNYLNHHNHHHHQQQQYSHQQPEAARQEEEEDKEEGENNEDPVGELPEDTTNSVHVAMHVLQPFIWCDGHVASDGGSGGDIGYGCGRGGGDGHGGSCGGGCGGNGHGKRRSLDVAVTRQVVLITLSFCLAWTPFAVVSLMGVFGLSSLVTPLISVLPGIVAKTATVINPVVFALGHPQYHTALLRCYRRAWWRRGSRVLSKKGRRSARHRHGEGGHEGRPMPSSVYFASVLRESEPNNEVSDCGNAVLGTDGGHVVGGGGVSRV